MLDVGLGSEDLLLEAIVNQTSNKSNTADDAADLKESIRSANQIYHV